MNEHDGFDRALRIAVNRMLDSGVTDFKTAEQVFARYYLSQVVNNHRGNISKAAFAIGLHRNSLGRLCDKLAIRTFRLRIPVQREMVERDMETGRRLVAFPSQRRI